jgi:glutathione S-transferase
MPAYTLYGFNGSTYTRTIRLLLHEKGIAYEQVPVNILAGEAQSAEHLERHPFGKIPAFAADGLIVYETDAIAELIEGQNPGAPTFIPDAAVARARMRQWMGTIDDYSYAQLVGTIVWQRVVKPLLDEETDETVCRDALPAARYHFALFDAALAQSAYLAGERLSLADLYLAPIMGYLSMTPEGERLLGEHRNVARWWEALSMRESFQQTPPA